MIWALRQASWLPEPAGAASASPAQSAPEPLVLPEGLHLLQQPIKFLFRRELLLVHGDYLLSALACASPIGQPDPLEAQGRARHVSRGVASPRDCKPLTREGGWYNEKAGKQEPGVNRWFGRNSTPIVDQARSVIGASGRAGASPERGRAAPFQGTWPCRAGIIGQPMKVNAGPPKRAAAAVTCREPGEAESSAFPKRIDGEHFSLWKRNQCSLMYASLAR